MASGTDKEKLESFIRTLDKFVIGFGIPLAIGVVGEDVFHSPRFGVLVAIGVIGDVLVGIPNFLKRRELEALQRAENLQQEREIASLRRDAAEATRRAEESRLAALQVQERLVRRQITEENQVNMIAALRPFANAGRLVDLVSYPNDSEVAEFAYQLSQVLQSAGWRPAEYGPESKEPLSGILVEIDPKNPPTRVAANALLSSLSAAGIRATGPVSSLPRQGNLTVSRGTRPVGAAIRVTIGASISR